MSSQGKQHAAAEVAAALAAAVTARVVAHLREAATPAKAATPAAPTGPEWLPPKRAADRLGISEKTLESWRSRGAGPPWSRVGSRVRYNGDDLDRWARSRAAKRGAEAPT